MSRRRIEAGITNQGSFSLRALANSATTEPTASTPSARTAFRGAAPPAIPKQAALSFKFDSLASSRPASTPSTPTSPCALPANFFSKSNATAKGAESMRLAAVVEDLTTRLRKASDAKTTLEQQVARLNGALVQERAAAQQRIVAMQTEVSTVQDSEMRLRTELAQRPVAREVDTQQFASRVRSALEQEETNAKVADAEARLSATCKRYESLDAEVRLLERRKSEALETTATAISQEDLDALLANAAEAETSLRDSVDRKASIDDDILRLTSTRDEHQKEMKLAEMALFKANEATSAAAADEIAAKEQLANVQLIHTDLGNEISTMQAKLEALSTAVSSPSTFSVTGADAPDRRSTMFDCSMAQVESAGCCGEGIGYHFEHDAPLNITSIAPDPSSNSVTNQMVTALVTDLQSYFKSAASEHDRVGRVASIGAIESEA